MQRKSTRTTAVVFLKMVRQRKRQRIICPDADESSEESSDESMDESSLMSSFDSSSDESESDIAPPRPARQPNAQPRANAQLDPAKCTFKNVTFFTIHIFPKLGINFLPTPHL